MFENPADLHEAALAAGNAADAYYATEAQVMTDADYDALLDRVSATIAAHPDWATEATDRILNRVAAGVPVAESAASAGLVTVTHPSRMLSLDKTTDTNPDHNAISENEDLRAFLYRGGITGYNVEVKLDGNAIRAVYDNGHLVLAATRGDGETGEDITPNAIRGTGIAGLPVNLPHPFTGEVRGEVFMTETDFEAASNNRVAAGGKPFANPRNAVSGSLRAIDRTYDAPMSFGAYSIDGTATINGTSHDTADLDTHVARMAFAETLNITTAATLTPGNPYADSVSDANFQIVRIKSARDTLGFPIDGAVISYDTIASREAAGIGNRAPKWAMAWKYPPREAESVLRSVEVAVGKTGRMSLTAHIHPVYLDGSTVSKASGHNAPRFQAWGLGIGHRVMVVKRGDIIPYISLLDGPQPEDVTPWVAPDTCPQCAQPWNKDSLLWRCETPECSTAGRLDWWASRDCLDIEGLGTVVAEALAEHGTATDVADLYFLSREQWATLPLGTTSTGGERRLGEANADKIIASLEASKAQPLNRVITGLGIRGTGRTVGRWLAKAFPTMARLRAASVEDLAAIEGLGPIKAQLIADGLVRLGPVIDRLALAGVNMGSEPDLAQAASLPFTGHTYVISGSVPGFTRTQAQERIEALGGRASSSVSKTTTALVTSETGTSKAKKAADLGVRVIDPEEFAALLR